jgi:Transketolase, thiamine diphosphate binding domain
MAMAGGPKRCGSGVLRLDPSDPIRPNRDRLVLLAGHASLLLCGLLQLAVDPWQPDVAIRRVRPARQVQGRRRGDGVLTRIGGWMVPSRPGIEAGPSGSTGTASCRLPTALWQESLTVRRGGRKHRCG